MDQKELATTLSEYVGQGNIRGVVFQTGMVIIYHSEGGVPASMRNEITDKLPGIVINYRQRKHRGGRPLPKTYNVRHR